MSDTTTATAAPQEAVTTTTANQAAAPTTGDGTETFDRAYVEKLRAEAAANRVAKNEAIEALATAKKDAERSKLDEVERLRAEIKDRDDLLAQAKETVRRANLQSSLAGKVSDPILAMAVVDSFVGEGDTIDFAGLIAAHPSLSMATGPRGTPVGPSNPAADPREGAPVTTEDFRGKSPEEARRLLAKLNKQRTESRSGTFAGTKLKY